MEDKYVHSIEQHTIQQIPLNARYGKARDLFTLWFGGNLMLLTFVTGSVSVTHFSSIFCLCYFKYYSRDAYWWHLCRTPCRSRTASRCPSNDSNQRAVWCIWRASNPWSRSHHVCRLPSFKCDAGWTSHEFAYSLIQSVIWHIIHLCRCSDRHNRWLSINSSIYKNNLCDLWFGFFGSICVGVFYSRFTFRLFRA